MQAAIPQGVSLHGIAIDQVLSYVFPRHASHIIMASNAEPLDGAWLRELRSKKAMTLVCKDWHVVALSYLYRDISIRYVWQFVLLSRTITSAPQTFGHLVRSLRIICHVPEHLVQAASKCLNTIVGTCPLLQELFLEEAFTDRATFPSLWGSAVGIEHVPPDTPSSPSWCLPVTNIAALQRITTLSMVGYRGSRGTQLCWTVPTTLNFITMFTNVTKLSMQCADWTDNDPLIEFHSLHSLCMWPGGDSPQLPTRWKMPQLRQVRLVPSGWRQDSYSNLEAFLLAYGPTITYLDLGDASWDTMERFVNLCPLLQRLSVGRCQCESGWSSPDLEAHGGPALSRKIQHVDIIDHMKPPSPRERIKIGCAPQCMQQFSSNIRFVDDNLLYLCHDLLDLFPPDDPDKNLTSTFDLFGHRVVQAREYIYLEAPEWSKVEEDERGRLIKTWRKVPNHWPGRAKKDLSDGEWSEDEEWMEETAEENMLEEIESEAREWEARTSKDDRNGSQPASTEMQMTDDEVLEIFYQRLR